MKRAAIKKWSVVAFLFVILFSACKKDKDNDSKPTGFWKGLYGSGSTVPNQPYAMLFRDNGTVRIYAQSADTTFGSKAEGTYTVNGSTIRTNYTYISGTIVGTFSTSANTDGQNMTGTYGSGTATSGGGTFVMSRQ